jgi:cellulose synthase/poly-beta-1,6-N-acetylglucosamine synthase-like glycosyltransferase
LRALITFAGGLGVEDENAQRAEMAHCLTRLFLRDTAPDGTRHVLCADLSPENRAWLKAYTGNLPLQPVPRAELLVMLRARFDPALLDDAIFQLARRTPGLSARTVVTRGQIVVFSLVGALLTLALALHPADTGRAVMACLSLAYIVSGLFRAVLALLGSASRPVIAPATVALPVYSILVPLYREVAVLPGLVRSLGALDYPAERLDIKLVLEADDHDTIAAARALQDSGAAPFELVLVPPGGPRTKPKAINYALSFARGEYLVIYDAEDRPEPDQLARAVAAFRGGPRTLACLQAKLNFYNANHNWLTRMFALDYALWFDVLLPGLDRIGVPMPLGGTSNHFRTAVLRAIGGWDAFNVTEDADIGIRLAQLGYGVSMLDSTTFEEAPTRLGAWLRQRSRWMKGYLQTWLVHMRDPLALARRTGVSGFLSFQLFIGGALVFALVTPPLWIAFLLTLMGSDDTATPGPMVPGMGLLAGNLLLTWLAVLAPRRRGWETLAPYGLTVVAYWAMISAAGYRGLWQLFTRPFFWEKTEHGGE